MKTEKTNEETKSFVTYEDVIHDQASLLKKKNTLPSKLQDYEHLHQTYCKHICTYNKGTNLHGFTYK
jgi:hypothetical protein